MPTNKTTQWREEWSKEIDNEMPMVFIVDGEKEIADWWITKFATTLELLEKEVEILRPDKCNCVGAYECYHWGKHEAVEDVLAIIRQHKEK